MSIDLYLIIFASIFIIMIILNSLSLNKVNNSFEIFQKDKPSKEQIINILSNKSPTIILGELEEWFIFNENDTIDEKKLNNITLNENSSNLSYICPIVRSYNIKSYNRGATTLIKEENSSRHFLILLEGELSIYLFNPNQRDKIEMNGYSSSHSIYQKKKEFKNVKYMEIKLHKEQILYIPFRWLYCFKCSKNCKILDMNSENILSLPYKIVRDKIKSK
jgi:hypothetical protein